MSKVASLTISAKSRGRTSSSDGSTTSPRTSKFKPEDEISEENQNVFHLNDELNGSSGSEDDKNLRGRGSSSGSSPERKSLSQRSYDTYDQERGLIHSGRSGKMSSRQRTLERELETEDPNLVASSDDALASSDDGLEDNFIPRKSKDKDKYYMVKSGSDSDQGGSIYEKKNVEPPRKKSEGAGNRVRSRTGELFSNYKRDQSFDGLSEEERGIEKPKTSVSILKAAYSKKAIDSKTVDRYKVDEELEQIRYTMQNRGMMQNDDSDDDRGHTEGTQDVLYRKSLSSIKDRFFAAASGRKVRSSSDSEEDTEDGDTKEQVIAPPQKVVDMKDQWQSRKSWHEKNKVDAKEDIDVSQVGSARSTFKQLESRQETVSAVNRPRGNKIADPQQIMGERRQKTYGDGEQVDGIIKHEGQDELSTVEIDTAQINQAKQSFKKLESSRYREQPNLRKPSMKIIRQEDVRKTMDDHRRKVSAEDFDDYAEHIKQNGSIAMTVTPTMTNGDVEHFEEH